MRAALAAATPVAQIAYIANYTWWWQRFRGPRIALMGSEMKLEFGTIVVMSSADYPSPILVLRVHGDTLFGLAINDVTRWDVIDAPVRDVVEVHTPDEYDDDDQEALCEIKSSLAHCAETARDAFAAPRE